MVFNSFWRYIRCPSRWYCKAAGRVECDRCGCYLRPAHGSKKG